MCEQTCSNTAGSFRCTCRPGYTLTSAGTCLLATTTTTTHTTTTQTTTTTTTIATTIDVTTNRVDKEAELDDRTVMPAPGPAVKTSRQEVGLLVILLPSLAAALLTLAGLLLLYLKLVRRPRPVPEPGEPPTPADPACPESEASHLSTNLAC